MYNHGYYSYNVPYYTVPYYYDNSYANLPYYDDRLPVQTLVPVATIQSHLNAGRQGHCFRGFWGNTQHTFILMGINNTTGMVQILEGGLPNEVHHTDIVGLQYLGLTCPGGGQGGQWGNCFQQFIPGVGWVWICR
ncbi:hypothetical protein [Peribacillus simplex]|uniref:hypothetical protein n=1 Tax=Peribacillus simplex TaxID=1478 RepID=UPI0024C047B6|nr:hypothetical protein [Peribacillus simplex]WHY96563.1 hypothetical protein QNH37_21710 [Peribacillus simplex]